MPITLHYKPPTRPETMFLRDIKPGTAFTGTIGGVKAGVFYKSSAGITCLGPDYTTAFFYSVRTVSYAPDACLDYKEVHLDITVSDI